MENTLHSETYRPRMPGSVFKILTESIGIIEKGESCPQVRYMTKVQVICSWRTVCFRMQADRSMVRLDSNGPLWILSMFILQRKPLKMSEKPGWMNWRKDAISFSQYFDFGMMLSNINFNNDEELARTAIRQQMSDECHACGDVTMGAACVRQCKATYGLIGLQNQGEKNCRGSIYSKVKLFRKRK